MVIENAKQAHAAGKVWVRIKINGGSIKWGSGSIGSFEIEGAYTPLEARAIFEAATADLEE